MPGRTRRTAPIEDIPLTGMESLDPDPQPAAARRGRPKGSTTKKTVAPKIRARASNGRVMSAAQIQQQVTTEMYGMATLLIGVWGIKDPECAGVWHDEIAMPGGGSQERLAAVVSQVVDIFAGNDKVMAVLSGGGLIAKFGFLGATILPAVKQVWQAHGPGGHGHRPTEGADGDYAREYPVFQPA